jgi:hypothetical protein
MNNLLLEVSTKNLASTPLAGLEMTDATDLMIEQIVLAEHRMEMSSLIEFQIIESELCVCEHCL